MSDKIADKIADNCAICLNIRMISRCRICNFSICHFCGAYRNNGSACYLCIPIDNIYICNNCGDTRTSTNEFAYCFTCDRVLCSNCFPEGGTFKKIPKCNSCTIDKAIRDIPHYGNVIELINRKYIKDLADIIIGYYYQHRRYTNEEMLIELKFREEKRDRAGGKDGNK